MTSSRRAPGRRRWRRRRRWRETGVSETCARQTTVRDWQSSARRRPYEPRTSGRRTLPPRSPPTPPNVMRGCRRRRKALWGSSRPCGGQRAIAHARTCPPAPRFGVSEKKKKKKYSLDMVFSNFSFFFPLLRYHHCYRSKTNHALSIRLSRHFPFPPPHPLEVHYDGMLYSCVMITCYPYIIMDISQLGENEVISKILSTPFVLPEINFFKNISFLPRVQFLLGDLIFSNKRLVFMSNTERYFYKFV